MAVPSASDHCVPLLTPTEVAERLRVSSRTVRRLSATGELERIHIGRRTVRYTPAVVEEFIRTRSAHVHNDDGPAASEPVENKELRHARRSPIH
jgi:excisionase family DNA binding protein